MFNDKLCLSLLKVILIPRGKEPKDPHTTNKDQESSDKSDSGDES